MTAPDVEWLSSLLAPLLTPAYAFVDPARRLFLPYLLLAIGIAAVLSARELSRQGLKLSARRLRRLVWPQGFLRGPSVRLDAALFTFNQIWKAMLLPSAKMMAAGVAAVAVVTCRALFISPAEDARPSPLHPTLIAALYTTTLFVASDLSRYLLHAAMHRVPALWRLHQIHHSAERLSPLTLHRVHPLESLFFSIRGAVAAGVVTGVFAFIFGAGLNGWMVLGVNVFGAGFNLLGSNLRHSHIWFSFGPQLERWFLSPAQHQVHHSQASEHDGKNLGSFLAVWDRLFGTLYVPQGRTRLRFGLAAGTRNHDDALLSALFGPFRRLSGKDAMVKPNLSPLE